MSIKNRIFALIGLDMILPTNFIYYEIFNASPHRGYSDWDWVVAALFDRGVDVEYWWMWAFIMIAYFIFSYKTEGGELSKNRGDTS